MSWEYYISSSNDVYYNLALEEYFIRHFSFIDRSILFIYRNNPAIVLGKNQNLLKEINLKFQIENSNYAIARRISGGGTVVHDLGNINIAIFEPYDIKKVNQYSSSSGKVAEVLNNIGIDCHLNARNAIVLANGHKVSGSAQFSNRNVILSHLTLLYQSDIDKINMALQTNLYTMKTKASPSVVSTIDNVGNYTAVSLNEFIQYLISFLGIEKNLNEDIIAKEKLNELIGKYSHKDYYYDLALNGCLKNDKVEIDFSEGKIVSISGLENEDYYQGKRLLPDEIPIDKPLWNILLHTQLSK